MFLYPFWGKYRNHHVCPMSCKHNFSLMDEAILMKLYTVAVKDLRMGMKEDNHLGPSYFKGDN